MSEVTAYCGAIFLVIAFVCLILVLRAPAALRRVLAIGSQAAMVLRDPNLSDEVKEKAAQRSSGQLFGLFLLIVLIFAAALVAPAAVLWLLDRAHLLQLSAVLAAATSATFLVACTLFGCAVSMLWPRMRSRRTGAQG